VLSDAHKRHTYDQYGEEGLIDTPSHQAFGSSSSSNNNNNAGFNPRSAEDIFTEFFGRSPFEYCGRSKRRYSSSSSSDGGVGGGISSSSSTAAASAGSDGNNNKQQKPPPIENSLRCTLEELYSGSVRKMKISRTILDPNGHIMPETDILPADLIFIIDEKKHDVYKTDANDLTTKQRVTLAEAIGGTTLNLTTLDARTLTLPVTDIITPNYELLIANEGMPITKEPRNKGRLRVKFDILFPSKLTQQQKAALKHAFNSS
ncbi:hypothetical protein V2J09_022559, partial [Rumex salicifolius]